MRLDGAVLTLKNTRHDRIINDSKEAAVTVYIAVWCTVWVWEMDWIVIVTVPVLLSAATGYIVYRWLNGPKYSNCKRRTRKTK